MGAIDAEKKRNKELLDSRRTNFTDLKKQMQRIEEEESKAKSLVEEALKKRNTLDEYCKKIKVKIRDNRDRYKT